MADTELRHEKAKLQKVLHRWDLLLFGACAIIGLDTVAAGAATGGASLVWLVLSLLLFLVPYGFVTAELGTSFPAEGGIYAWATLSYGKLTGEITAILYWLSNAIWIGGTLAGTSIAAINVFVLPDHPVNTTWSIVIGLIFVWVNIGIAVVSLKHGKWAGNLGAAFKAIAVFLFVGLVIAYLVKHGVPASTVTAHDMVPNATNFLAVVGIIVFLWVGFELESSASEEMVDPQRDVPRGIVGSGVMSAALYLLVIGGILLVIPTKDLTNVGGWTDAYATVATVLGGAAKPVGYLVAVIIILTLIGSGSVWILGSCRVQAVAALDGAAPRILGRFSREGTPIAMALLSGIVGSAFVFMVFLLASGSLANFFAVMLSLSISTAVLAYFFSIPAAITLRRKYPDVPRPFRVPGGVAGLWICVVLSEAGVILTGITLLWPGLIEGLLGKPYSIQDSWGVSRLFFEGVTMGTFLVIILIAVTFWAIGRAQARGTLPESGVELIEGVVTEEP